MSKLKFKSNKALVKLAKETLKRDSFKIAYSKETTKEKCFFLVKDEGIYLMNAYLNTEGTPTQNGTVVYAIGYNPQNNPNCWEDTYEVSRDDFGMNLNLTNDQLERLANGGNISVTLNDDYYEVVA